MSKEFYEVTQAFKGVKVGDIVDDSSYRIRRKIQEGGCLKKISSKEKKEKMDNRSYDNKMIKPEENKNKEGGK